MLGAISSRLAVNWQVGQLIDFLFSCTALYGAISSRLAVNWQVGQLISNGGLVLEASFEGTFEQYSRWVVWVGFGARLNPIHYNYI